MIHSLLASLVACCLTVRPVALSDVPATHWARAAVLEVVSRGVMNAPGGKFHGGDKVNRRELAITLAAFARSLEKGHWPKTPVRPVKKLQGAASLSESVTRYQLAAVLSRAARYVGQGIPKATGKTFGESEALPPKAKVSVPRSDPAFEAVTYLAQNRMAFGNSVALQPGPQPVTGAELADALSIMIVGLDDRLTDEPQNREDLGPPPSERRQGAPPPRR